MENMKTNHVHTNALCLKIDETKLFTIVLTFIGVAPIAPENEKLERVFPFLWPKHLKEQTL